MHPAAEAAVTVTPCPVCLYHRVPGLPGRPSVISQTDSILHSVDTSLAGFEVFGQGEQNLLGSFVCSFICLFVYFVLFVRLFVCLFVHFKFSNILTIWMHGSAVVQYWWTRGCGAS